MTSQQTINLVIYLQGLTLFAVMALHGYHFWDTFRAGMRRGAAEQLKDRMSLARKIHTNRAVYDPAAGVLTVFDDDGTTVLKEFPIG